MNTVIKDIAEITEETVDLILSNFNEVEFINGLSKSHPNLTYHLGTVLKINSILYGRDISYSITRSTLLIIYLLFLSNEDDTFKSMFSDDDVNSLNEILGKL